MSSSCANARSEAPRRGPARAEGLLHIAAAAAGLRRGGRWAAGLRRSLSLALLLPALLLPALLLASAGLRAQDVQPVPALSGRLIDQTLTLDPPQRSALEAQLATLERERGSQLVVLMVGSTLPEDVAAYAQRVADAWKIGRREVGDGVLLVVAKNDRRVRIEVAKALEGALPDLAARQIIDSALRPAFRANDYAGGLQQAITMIDARLRGEALPAPGHGSGGGGGGGGPSLGFNLEDLGLLLFVAVPVVATLVTRLFGRKLGSLLVAAGAGTLGWWVSHSLVIAAVVGVAALIVVGIFGIGSAARRVLGGRRRGSRGGEGWSIGTGSTSWGGGGWSSGGGDSFSSGGGGDFGGGGASGDW